MDDLKKYIPLYLRICRTLSLYLCFLVLVGLCSLCFRFSPLPCTVLLPLLFHSTARIFGETDRNLRDLALAYRAEHDIHHRSPKAIVALLLQSPSLRIELLVLLLLPVILPFEVGLGSPVKLLFGAAALPRFVKKAAALLLMLPLFLGGWLLARYFAFLFWAYEEGFDKGDHYLGSLVLKFLSIAALYLIGSLAGIFFIPVFLSIYYISEALVALRWWLPAALIILPILSLYLIRLARAWRIRRRFLRDLFALCSKIGATVSRPKRPFRSLVRLRDEVNFIIHHGEKTYTCKLFGSLKRNSPLYFSEKGIVQCLHSFRFRRVEYFRYTTQFDFSFEGEGQKLLIVNPVPKEIFAGDTSFFRLIDTGERVGEYTVFTASGLLGAISRDVVDR